MEKWCRHAKAERPSPLLFPPFHIGRHFTPTPFLDNIPRFCLQLRPGYPIEPSLSSRLSQPAQSQSQSPSPHPNSFNPRHDAIPRLDSALCAHRNPLGQHDRCEYYRQPCMSPISARLGPATCSSTEHLHMNPTTNTYSLTAMAPIPSTAYANSPESSQAATAKARGPRTKARYEQRQLARPVREMGETAQTP
jgi:hypothetical protein